MRLLVINPNTTASMTEKIGIAAKGAASPGTEIMAMNPASGCLLYTSTSRARRSTNT